MVKSLTPITYDLIVIGAGAAGLTASLTAAQLGIKVALIEKDLTGGDCTWYGCVPSKALLAAAKRAHDVRHAAHLGIYSESVRVDFAAVMRHVRGTIHDIYEDESPEALRHELAAVYEAAAQFIDPRTVALSTGEHLRAKRFIICSGSSPIVPPIFTDVPHLTNKTLFTLEALPEHLLIVGGGAFGVEMAQAFRRLGARVTLIEQQPQLLPRDDPEAAQLITDTLRAEGVEVCVGQPVVDAYANTDAEVRLRLADDRLLVGSHVLLAMGRKPTLAPLSLAAARIALDANGTLRLKPNLQTSQRHIYAAGDVTGGWQFTHNAGQQGYIAVRNAFLPFPANGIAEIMPWTTYTEPESAQVGLTEPQARSRYGASVQVLRLPMTRSDRAMTEGDAQGFLKLVYLEGGKLLGVTIVGTHAGEVLNEWVSVVQKGGKVGALSGKMRVYPTFASVNSVLVLEYLKGQVKSAWWGKALQALIQVIRAL